MKAYRMVTPPDLCPRTLRWVAEHAVAHAKDFNDAAAELSDEGVARIYYGRAKLMNEIASSMRARAGRIEGKQKRARGRR